DAVAVEAELLVEPDRGPVGDAHLERVAAALVVGGQLEQPLEEPRRDPAALVLRVDGDVHHVPGVDIAGVDDVADELVALERAEADRRALRGLGGEHRAGPGRLVRALLDLLDLGEVTERETPDLDRDGRHADGFASGWRR